MANLVMFWKYLSYVLRHKWFVMIECFKQGLIIRGLMHDMSKLFPSEFFAYMNHFYGKNKANGSDPKFDKAWLRHQNRNDHHWQWWTLIEDEGDTFCMVISKDALIEMLCDWIGAGKALGKKSPKGDAFAETRKWYIENRMKIKMHPASANSVHAILGIRIEQKPIVVPKPNILKANGRERY